MAGMGDLPALLAAEDWDGAERLLRRAAKARTAPAEVHYNLAKVLMENGKAAQAGQWFRRAVAARPDYAAAWFEMGRWALVADDLPLAFRAFQKASKLAPADRDARISLGRIALRCGQWDVARRAWDGVEGTEALQARYRIAAETGDETGTLLERLLSADLPRPQSLTTITRTAKGRIPRVLPRRDP